MPDRQRQAADFLLPAVDEVRRSSKRHFLLGATGLAAWLAVGAGAGAQGRKRIVGFSQDAADTEWRAVQARQLVLAFGRVPDIEFQVSVAEGNSAKQVIDIENFIERKVDLLIVSPRDAELLAEPVAKAYRAGIPVLLNTRHVSGEQYTTHIGPDDYGIGRAAARFIAGRLQGRGAVVMLEGRPSTSTAQERTRGFLDGLKKFPDVHLVQTRVANYQRSEAVREVEDLLRTKVEFSAIYAHNDTMASGARLALRRGRRDPKSIVLVGIDYLPEARDAILAGEQTASFIYPTCVPEIVRAAQEMLAGRRVARRILVPSTLVDSGNVQRVKSAF